MSEQEPQELPDALPEAGSVQPVESRVRGMYREYFLDYASYVILERAVPGLDDGLKPVQRRLMHAMREMEDGRFHKVANIIGQTMKYHPHGDASIGDALVGLGQKNLLVDTQGNWGNILTGDSAAASRYIEARLSKFALEVAFNPKITDWQSSYDGRGREPLALPVKFPLLLAQGAEGIAVGLSTKIMPHNFVELIDASIKHLKGRSFQLVPDFPTGGIADTSGYNDGNRGGKVRVRARISVVDKKTLSITEIPFGTTTTSLIDSILKANDKGKVKIRKVEDNTAEAVEILVHLPSGVSPDQTVDALYAFTNCEVSISPISCVIQDNKPVFVGVRDLLKASTDHTVELLRAELEIQLKELQEQWHFASLEKIFIEQRIYRDIEEATTWEQVLENIWEGLKPHISHLLREVTEEDIVRLTEIKIKRISKFDSDKANDKLESLEGDIAEVKGHLNELVEYAINYFTNLKKKYGKGRERKTELRSFDSVNAARVAIANAKLYVNREEGFIGTSMRRDEFVCDCSDIDDVVVILKDGTMMVTKIDDKKFVGKDIIHVAVFKKGDDRTIYNLIYRDGSRGPCYIKRFPIKSITRDKAYPLTAGNKGSKVMYLSVNPNGEAEVVSVALRAGAAARKLKFDMDFAEVAVRGRSTRGKTVTKHSVKNILMKSEGVSTLAARKIWFEDAVLKLNDQERGRFIGDFMGGDRLAQCDSDGMCRLILPDFSTHFEEVPWYMERWAKEKPFVVVYFDASKERYMVKRFLLEFKNDQWSSVIPEGADNKITLISQADHVRIGIEYRTIKGKQKDAEEVQLEEFIAVKGASAAGNMLTSGQVKKITIVDESNDEVPEVEEAMVLEATPEPSAPEPTSPESAPAKKPSPKTSETDPEDDEGQFSLNF